MVLVKVVNMLHKCVVVSGLLALVAIASGASVLNKPQVKSTIMEAIIRGPAEMQPVYAQCEHKMESKEKLSSQDDLCEVNRESRRDE